MNPVSLLERELKPNENRMTTKGTRGWICGHWCPFRLGFVLYAVTMICDFPQIRGGQQISILIGPVAKPSYSGECAYDTL